MTHWTYTEEQTKKLATEFARTLHGGEVIFLEGEFGSGKTTFVRFVAQALGFHDTVRSPSFTIVNRYPISHELQILHVDCYRLKDQTEFMTLALEEEMGKKDIIAFIEWPKHENIKLDIFPTHTITFTNLHPPRVRLHPHS